MNKIWTLKSIKSSWESTRQKIHSSVFVGRFIRENNKTSMEHLVAGAGVPSFNNASSHVFFVLFFPLIPSGYNVKFFEHNNLFFFCHRGLRQLTPASQGISRGRPNTSTARHSWNRCPSAQAPGGTSFGNGLLLYPTHHLATLQIMFYIHEVVVCSHSMLSQC